ncbi:MAG: ribD 1 [Candidatus Acidoferrum typicum]|nr:ribD 1 [Candidatus Acidoferrum typicum]
MTVDSEIAKYAETRFSQRLEDEIMPAYRERLREEIARWNPNPQRPFSGSQAQALIAVEARYARESARTQAESLIEALEKAGLPFNDDAFRKALDDTKKLLERHSQYSYRTVVGYFNTDAVPKEAIKALEQDVESEMARIHDSILRFVKVKLQETVLTARKTQHSPSVDEEDRKFANLAIDEARQSVSEQDGKPHPLVGAVVVKNGKVLSSAHRGEVPGNHAEFTALDKKLAEEAVCGATIYTTLEPCTTRNHPKIPCVKRIIDRKVARVVVGMLDPDPRITGRGMLALRNANIAIDLFPPDLMTEIEELNREFKRLHEQQSHLQLQTSKVFSEVNTPEDENPPTLLDLFKNSFSNTLKLSDNEPAIAVDWTDASTTKIRRQVYMDFPAKTKFVGFYVPAATPPSADISGGKTFTSCMKLLEADAIQQALEHVLKQVAILAGQEGQMTSIQDLTFSGRVLIYHDEYLSIPQKADIIRAYAAKNFDVQFMGADYLGSQVIAWHHKRVPK